MSSVINRYVLILIFFIIFLNSISYIYSHKCFDCEAKLFKHSCCEKEKNSDHLRSGCNCCNKEIEKGKKYYTLISNYKIRLLSVVESLIDFNLLDKNSIEGSYFNSVYTHYGGSLKLPKYKEVRHLII